jgi:hypothetical protein
MMLAPFTTAGQAGATLLTERPLIEVQTDVLIDTITGAGRDRLEGLPCDAVYELLCSQLRDMGLEPNPAKVRQIAGWIASGPADSDDLDD